MIGPKELMGLCEEYLIQAMGAPLPLEINPQYIASQVLEHHHSPVLFPSPDLSQGDVRGTFGEGQLEADQGVGDRLVRIFYLDQPFVSPVVSCEWFVRQIGQWKIEQRGR